MTAGGRLCRRWLAALFLLLTSIGAPAHEMSMAEMEVRETAPGQFFWQWTATSDRQGNQADLKPIWPEGCVANESALRCGPGGLKGALGMEGVGKRYSAAIVKVYWQGSPGQVYTLTAAQPTIQLYGAADDRRGLGEIARAYTVLGVEHILTGIDHLLFVVGLLFLVGFRRRLFWTITAFTAAHSLTLALGALGILTLHSPPVEATIALSIMLVAGEALRDRETLARRWPALVAFVFGLVHGLGFAGALQAIGLPQQHLAVALLTFNLGVEFGQLLTVGAAWAVVRMLRRQAWAPRLRTPIVYLIGSLAAYWSLLRIAAILS